MDSSRLSLKFASSVSDIKPLNSSFDEGILKIAYWGFNNNKVHISREAFEQAIPSMFNCPVVCNYNRSTDSIGGHDMEVVNKDGSLRLVCKTNPVGVVPESAVPFWQEVEEHDGSTHEYLCAPVLFWKRQEAYEHIKENGITDESMEINVFRYEKKEDGFTYITSFEFTAFCLLESVSPCFESASVELFSADEFKDAYSRMMQDFKREFSQVNTASADDIDVESNAETFSKGGNDPLNINELLAKYELVQEDITFDYSDMDTEQLEARFAEIREQKNNSGEPEIDDNSDPLESTANADTQADALVHDGQVFSLTGEQFITELLNSIGQEKYQDPEWGEFYRYSYVDFDADKNEVYVYDFADGKLYGFSYIMNGDNVVIDFDSKKRMKISFVEFDNGVEQTIFSDIFSKFNEKKKALDIELGELTEYKQNAEKQQHKNDADKVFSKFADLEGNESFVSLKSKFEEYSIDELEEKCFAIRGRSVPTKFSQESGSNSIRIPAEHNTYQDPNEPYGGVFHEFGFGNR